MKKLILVLICIALSNCEIKPRSAQAYNRVTYDYHEEVHGGMTYGVWWTDGDGSNREDAVFVVNITKEQLEVELLRKQLAK